MARRRRRRRSKVEPMHLVIWGGGGDPAAAIIYISELRARGKAVKVIGIGGSRPKGDYGIRLESDITLREACEIAEAVAFIMLPFPNSGLSGFTFESKLTTLFNTAHDHGATFIECSRRLESVTLDKLFSRGDEYHIIPYDVPEELFEIIEELDWSHFEETQKAKYEKELQLQEQ